MSTRAATVSTSIDGGRRRRRPGLLALVAAGAALVLMSGCSLQRPVGPAQTRYVDEVFASVGVQQNLAYGSATGRTGQPETLLLDLYTPAGDTRTQRRPAVIWVHGGGFAVGGKADSNVVQLATTFAKRGYVAASVNYRLLAPQGCGGNPNPTQECINAAFGAQHDVQASVRWLRAHADQYGIDPNRIAVGGTSAGAVTSVLLATNATDPGDSGNPGYSSRVGGAVSISGGLPTNDLIDSTDSPVLFFHGDQDTTVPFAWSAQNAAALLNAGVLTIWEPLAGAGHVPFAQYHTLFFEQSAYFLYLVLDLSHAGQAAVSKPQSLRLDGGQRVVRGQGIVGPG
ncbi:MAG: carboxylesterase family protein [Actinomycetota bacterium]|nr:carboxylesterase family protein [Actinomycetota bacterium]